MNGELNIYNILKCLPQGIKLFVPEIGEVYLHTVKENDRFYEDTWSWERIFQTVGGVKRVIGLTKHMPYRPNCLSQYGGVSQYRYSEPEYLFDEYGHQLTPNNIPWCRIFPDKDMTWDNWQLKLFRKGYNLTAEYNDRDGVGIKTTYIGSMDKLERDKHSDNGYYIYLRDALKETLDSKRNLRQEHFDNVILHFTLPGVDGKSYMPIRLSTLDESHHHGYVTYALAHMDEGHWWDCAGYYASLRENKV
jgi:hypothetical protein